MIKTFLPLTFLSSFFASTLIVSKDIEITNLQNPFYCLLKRDSYSKIKDFQKISHIEKNEGTNLSGHTRPQFCKMGADVRLARKARTHNQL